MGHGDFLSNYKRLQGEFEALFQPAVSSIGLAETLRNPSEIAVGSGKRARPVLCLATAEMLGLTPKQVGGIASALEVIHNSSLIHDDLPALDNDDLRRGEPTCHIRFGEAVAILTGDALIFAAFALASSEDISAAVSQKWNRLLSDAGLKLCSGQAVDLALAGRVKSAQPLEVTEELFEEMCLQKTAALFRAAVLAPTALLSAAEERKFASHLSDYGMQLGLLFQLTDDMLDAEPSDFISRFGRKETESRVDGALNAALAALEKLPGDTQFLADFARMVRSREN